jgi:glycosyltransferase involved in cell wall biosynthesis
MRIDMFVYNRCTTDARVLKEAKTLAEAGHEVRIVAVLDQTTAPEEERDGFRIVRIDRNPIHYRVLRAGRAAGRLWQRPAAAMTERQASTRKRARDVALIPAYLLWRALRRALLSPHKPLTFFDYYRRAYRLVLADPPDALHAHDLNTLPVAAALARRLDLTLTYDAHELYPEISTLSRREARAWRLIERRLAPRADNVLTVCDSIADEMTRRYAIARPSVLLNCPVAAIDDGTVADRGGAAVDLDDPVILYQGGFAPNRGLETVVHSAVLLSRGRVVLMGWGSLGDELRELIAAEGVAERVTIVPPVPREEVIARAAEATVGVIPYEPVGLNNTFTTPNKLFDYMAAGLPIAASRLPELQRFVEGEEIGLTFTPGDPASLAACLDRLLTDPERHAEMRHRAHEAAERYTWERQCAALTGLYDGMLRLTPGAR